MKCFIHPAIYLAQTARKGRGMFCRKALMAGELVETAPLIPIDTADRNHLRATLLRNYIFGWPPGPDGLRCCIALGYLSIYNHAFIANCNYEKDYERQTMSIVAVRDIVANEELTINYNGTWDDISPLWFNAE